MRRIRAGGGPSCHHACGEGHADHEQHGAAEPDRIGRAHSEQDAQCLAASAPKILRVHRPKISAPTTPAPSRRRDGQRLVRSAFEIEQVMSVALVWDDFRYGSPRTAHTSCAHHERFTPRTRCGLSAASRSSRKRSAAEPSRYSVHARKEPPSVTSIMRASARTSVSPAIRPWTSRRPTAARNEHASPTRAAASGGAAPGPPGRGADGRDSAVRRAKADIARQAAACRACASSNARLEPNRCARAPAIMLALRGDRTQRQLRGSAALHDPHYCREHFCILHRAAPWTHLVLDIN